MAQASLVNIETTILVVDVEDGIVASVVAGDGARAGGSRRPAANREVVPRMEAYTRIERVGVGGNPAHPDGVGDGAGDGAGDNGLNRAASYGNVDRRIGDRDRHVPRDRCNNTSASHPHWGTQVSGQRSRNT